jgi:hypothetical protein
MEYGSVRLKVMNTDHFDEIIRQASIERVINHVADTAWTIFFSTIEIIFLIFLLTWIFKPGYY